MIKVSVIAPMGATVRGPAKLRLTEAQHASRATQLRKAPGKGVYELIGAVSFKRGEEFAIDDFDGKLNSALFENLSEKPKAKASKEADADDGLEDEPAESDDEASEAE